MQKPNRTTLTISSLGAFLKPPTLPGTKYTTQALPQFQEM